MKRTLILGVLLVLSGLLHAQQLDLIVTLRGDSIACKVDSITAENYHIKVRKQGRTIATTIRVSQVKTHSRETIDKKQISYIPGTVYFRSVPDSGVPPSGVAFSLLGSSPLAGVVLDRHVGKKGSLEFGIGVLSLGLGLKLYPQGIRTQYGLFHIGLTATAGNFNPAEAGSTVSGMVYLPLGVTVFGKEGFWFAADFGPGLLYDGYDLFPFPWGNLKLGFRF